MKMHQAISAHVYGVVDFSKLDIQHVQLLRRAGTLLSAKAPQGPKPSTPMAASSSGLDEDGATTLLPRARPTPCRGEKVGTTLVSSSTKAFMMLHDIYIYIYICIC